MKNLLKIVCISLLLCFSLTQLYATNEKTGGKTIENYFLVEPNEKNHESGKSISSQTQSATNRRITNSCTPYYSEGVLTRIAITITWEWITVPANYLEDTIAIGWASDSVDWRYDSNTIVRKLYSINSGKTSWSLTNTDYSIGSAYSNGFSYDQMLYSDLSGGHRHGTRNKGTVSFTVNPITSTVGKDPTFYLYIYYLHQVTGFGRRYSYDKTAFSTSCVY